MQYRFNSEEQFHFVDKPFSIEIVLLNEKGELHVGWVHASSPSSVDPNRLKIAQTGQILSAI